MDGVNWPGDGATALYVSLAVHSCGSHVTDIHLMLDYISRQINGVRKTWKLSSCISRKYIMILSLVAVLPVFIP